MPLPEAADSSGSGPAAVAELRPTAYEVKKGDAIVKIARKFNMDPAPLMQFNELKSDRILIGQILRIPSLDELLTMAPPPPDPKKKSAEGGEDGKPAGRPGLELPPATVEQLELETVLLQVFLDREMFSGGPIDGDSGPMFEKMGRIYQRTHPDAADFDQMKIKALAAVDHPYTSYALRAEDFRFIRPRNVEPVEVPVSKAAPARKKGAKPVQSEPQLPPVTYEELVTAKFLAYTSVWEFVAERFHCDESFLRRINSRIDGAPIVGTLFQVPNVIPFEIENALEPPLQPAIDPLKTITATVVGMSLLEISRNEQLIAVMPLASARPGLRGRGSWTVLDSIPRPRLATRHEPREAPPAPATTGDAPKPAAYLAPGPNNPVGVLWIDLAKSKSTDPLPYGLHGTSIPAQMKSLQGIGGLRLANWDIARAVRLMPHGTQLRWKAKSDR